MSDGTDELAEARATALQFFDERNAVERELAAARSQIHDLTKQVETLSAAGARHHVAELAEALGREPDQYATWRSLLKVVRDRLDRPLEEKLRAIKGCGEPDQTIPLHQLLDEIRWYIHVVTPERNRLMEQRRQLLDVLRHPTNAKVNVDTIVDDVRGIVEERERLRAEVERIRAENERLRAALAERDRSDEDRAYAANTSEGTEL